MPGSDDKGWIRDRRRKPDRRLSGRSAQRRRPAPRRQGARRRGSPRATKSAARRSAAPGERRNEAAWQPIALESSPPRGTTTTPRWSRRRWTRATRARARFSGFQVGAALETSTGEVVTGCNVENATYGLTMCAERVALYKALSDGKDVFTRIAVVADTDDPTPPCGSCRQLLWEYCGDIDVILANLSEVKRRMRLSQLLPLPFDARLLE